MLRFSAVTPPAIAAVLGLLFLDWGSRPVSLSAAKRPTPVSVTRIYTGPDGLSHAERIDPKLGSTPGLKGLDQSQPLNATILQFARRSPDLVQDWHTAAQPQYAVTLSGRGEIEVAGGQKIRVEPRSILFFEDVTGKGHITRTIGKEDWTLMIVLLPKQ